MALGDSRDPPQEASVGASKVSVPQVQHPDRIVNQIQQNLVTAFGQLQQNQLRNTSAVGDIRESSLAESQFQTFYGSEWILADGRSVIDSEFQRLTGSTTVPDKTGGDTNFYVRVN